jgi:hypothetical protein
VVAKLRSRLSYANVVATFALFVALGGSSYAALTVTGKNVKNSSLTGADIKNNSVTGKDVKGIRSGDVTDRSLLAKDFRAGQLPTGPKGDKGDKGDRGPGAVDLHFSAPGQTGAIQKHTIAAAGPWTVSYSCELQPGHLFLHLFSDGPGDAQFAGLESFSDATPLDTRGGGFTGSGEFSTGQAGSGNFHRYAYTVQLHSAGAAATVTVNALADFRNTSAPTCFGNGTAVLAG